MKKLLIGFMVFVLVLVMFPAVVYADVNTVTPSTNDINRDNSWPHVDELSKGIGEVTLLFVILDKKNCFEYRTDGDTSQATGVNPNPLVTDGLYPHITGADSDVTMTIQANEYVEVRLVSGVPNPRRFDWTRFDVLPTKSDILMNSSVPGKGLENAPGLDKLFNPNSQADEHAGMK